MSVEGKVKFSQGECQFQDFYEHRDDDEEAKKNTRLSNF